MDACPRVFGLVSAGPRAPPTADARVGLPALPLKPVPSQQLCCNEAHSPIPAHPIPHRAGEPDVALDAYNHLLSQGHRPSPAAFRALLEVHLARADWEQADALLAAMVAQRSAALDLQVKLEAAFLLFFAGALPKVAHCLQRQRGLPGMPLAKPDACRLVPCGCLAMTKLEMPPCRAPASLQMLNGVIERACAAGNPAAAQSAFSHLCQAWLAPTAATFAPLLAALQRQHPPGEVAELAVGLAEQADQVCGTAGQGMQVSRFQRRGARLVVECPRARDGLCVLFRTAASFTCSHPPTTHHPPLTPPPPGASRGLPHPGLVGPLPAAAGGSGGDGQGPHCRAD